MNSVKSESASGSPCLHVCVQHSIVSLLEVHDRHETVSCCAICTKRVESKRWVEEALHCGNVVPNPATRNKTSLRLGDELAQKWRKSAIVDLGDDALVGVDERDRPLVLERIYIAA